MAAAASSKASFLSDGFISKAQKAAGREAYPGLGDTPPLPPDTTTIVTNSVLRIGKISLQMSNLSTEQLEQSMALINPSVGVEEAKEYNPILGAIIQMGMCLPAPNAQSLTSEKLVEFLNDVANNLFFPGKRVTWEGISMLMVFVALVTAEDIKHSVHGVRFLIPVNWCIDYVTHAKDEHFYPGVQEWIDQNTWNGICSHLEALLEEPLPEVPAEAAANSERCPCNVQRKDTCSDYRFPFFSCLNCFRGWCRIETCRETFLSIQELQQHQKVYHKYPKDIQENCACGNPKMRRCNFEASYQRCEHCNRIWCLINGCEQVCQGINRFNQHRLSKHPDPYTCRRCGKQSKPRDGVTKFAMCKICSNNCWCLRGYCDKELRTEKGILKHQEMDCVW